MKKSFNLFLVLSAVTLSAFAQPIKDDPSLVWFKKTTEVIHFQLNKAAQTYKPGKNPRSVNPDGIVRLAGLTDWTTGFFPGSLWYGYELTGDKALAQEAKKFTLALDAIFEAVKALKPQPFMNDSWVWLYRGAWQEWGIDEVEMAVPMGPDQVLAKRHGIFKHQSQKDGVVFQGTDAREFWQRAEDRNSETAELYNQLGLSRYAAMEAFVRWEF